MLLESESLSVVTGFFALDSLSYYWLKFIVFLDVDPYQAVN